MLTFTPELLKFARSKTYADAYRNIKCVPECTLIEYCKQLDMSNICFDVLVEKFQHSKHILWSMLDAVSRTSRLTYDFLLRNSIITNYCLEMCADYLPDPQFFKKFAAIIKIQRMYLRHYTRRKWAAKVIAQGCHNWLYKPLCKDGTIGIVPRIGLSYL